MAPSRPPTTVAMAMVAKATGREIRAPWTIRARMSRPTSSVPSQCSTEGGWSFRDAFC